MHINRLFRLILILLKFYHVGGSLFTCTAHFKESKRTAVDLVKNMDKYIKLEELKIQVLKRISASIKGQLTEELFRTKAIPPNPVSMYHYAKTVSDAMFSLEKLNNHTSDNSRIKELISMFSHGLPTEADVDGVAVSFIRLQNTYNLTASDVASGNILGIEVEPLTAFDCYDIGEVIFEHEYNRIAKQWFQTALVKVKDIDVTKTNVTEFMFNLNKYLDKLKRHDRIDKIKARITIASLGQSHLYPVPHIYHGDTSTYTVELIDMMKNNTLKYYGIEIDRNLKYYKDYETTCARRDVRFGGFCRYSRIEDLAFFKRPIKIEYINDSPRVVVVHDIIDKQLINHLQGYSDQLKRSKVIVENVENVDEPKDIHEGRTSSTFSYTDDMSNPLIIKLNDVLERLTGLRTNFKQADHLQLYRSSQFYWWRKLKYQEKTIIGNSRVKVVNYGIGGEYVPHFDWLSQESSYWRFHTETNRILTILLYLSDVEVGGSTVFPELGIAVSPVKGSALFFTNLDSDGHGDPLTLHAGCPVLFGSKWIANKWIHAKEQDMNFLQTVPSVWN